MLCGCTKNEGLALPSMALWMIRGGNTRLIRVGEMLHDSISEQLVDASVDS